MRCGRATRRSRELVSSLGVLLVLLEAGCSDRSVPEPPPAEEAPLHAPQQGVTALDGWTEPWRSDGSEGQVGDRCGGGLASRWLVVGWDGADWNLLLPLLERGRLPNLAAVMARGAYGDLYSIRPCVSPAVWTTVATGVSPARHGILGFQNPGVARLTASTDRRVPALWNLATDHGLTSVVIGFHGTFPVEPIDGVMVSNYLVHAYFAEERFAAAPDLAALGAALAYPEEALARLRVAEREVRRELPERITRFVSLGGLETAADFRRDQSLRARGAYWREGVKRGYLCDALDLRLALEYLPEVAPDLGIVHFQSVDWASHRFLYFHAPELFERVAWSDEVRTVLDHFSTVYRGTIAATYEYLDEALGMLLEATGPDTGLVLLSDHGFEPSGNPNITGEHHGAPPGVIVLAGPGIRAGARLEGANVYDVFPTLAAALGLPLERDLPGRILDEALCPGLLPLAVRTVDRYGEGAAPRPTVALPGEVEEAIKADLRSLGYLE